MLKTATTMNPVELRRAVSQLLVVRASGHAGDQQRRYPRWELSNSELQRQLENGVGGVILLGGTATELQQRCRTLRAWAADEDLLLCADVEEGVGQRFEGATWLVPPLALGRLHGHNPAAAIRFAERYGRCTADQARRCGLNWVLAPVCDVNSNPANPVINVRAWGQAPEAAAALAEAFQRGLQAGGVLGCAKHFPGHGDTAQDSHLELPVLAHARERLEELELKPFRRLIAAGVESVMTAHLLIPALDAERPATLSPKVLTDLLRVSLDFQGLIVTDALVMEAITGLVGPGEAAVQAFEAGADLILMPADVDEAINAVCAALASGRLPASRLEQSLQRRREALQRCRERQRQNRTASTAPSPPDAAETAAETAEEHQLALELVGATLEVQGATPVDAPAGGGVTLIRVDGVLACPFLRPEAPAISWPARRGFRPILCHELGISPWHDPPQADHPLALDRLGEGPVLLQLFLRGNPFRAGRDRDDPWPAAIRQLLALNRLAGLAVYGCPYRWESLRALLPSSIPAAYSPGQMAEAQQMLMGRLLGEEHMLELGGEFTD